MFDGTTRSTRFEGALPSGHDLPAPFLPVELLRLRTVRDGNDASLVEDHDSVSSALAVMSLELSQKTSHPKIENNKSRRKKNAKSEEVPGFTHKCQFHAGKVICGAKKHGCGPCYADLSASRAYEAFCWRYPLTGTRGPPPAYYPAQAPTAQYPVSTLSYTYDQDSQYCRSESTQSTGQAQLPVIPKGDAEYNALLLGSFSTKSIAMSLMQFYLSKENLVHDRYLLGLMNDDGFVSLKVLANFPRMKKLLDMRYKGIEQLWTWCKRSVDFETRSGSDGVQQLRRYYQGQRMEVSVGPDGVKQAE